MKKFLLLFVAALAIVTLHSCSLNSDLTFHKDKATTMQMDVDFSEMMETMKALDSGKSHEMKDAEKYPREWTSMYDLDVKEGKKVSTNPDSIKLMKKIFMKSNFTDESVSGISIKFDHFTNSDFEAVSKMKDKESADKMPFDNRFAKDWDGKKLVLETEFLNFDKVAEILAKEKEEENEEGVEETFKSIELMQMMLKDYTMNLRFESDIVSVIGKHDWITQTDKRTLQIKFDLASLDGSKKFKNKDKKIIITTE